MAKSETPVFFTTREELRAWLTANHAIASEQWVGFHRKVRGRPSINPRQRGGSDNRRTHRPR